MANDLELLQQYARSGSEEAFAALVQGHLNLVYSAALRQVRSPQLAEEIAQSVFSDLAQEARKLKPDTVLSAWLYQVTRRTAVDVIRRESRRQFRERLAVEMSDMNSNSSEWTQIEPLLDEAMEALDQTDRCAILLRYFENKSLREVGQHLCTSEDAAQKRVSRAVERLREFYAKRGVAVGASGLTAVLTSNAVQAAPVGLGLRISANAALSAAALHQAGAVQLTQTLAMTTMQKTLVAVTLTAAVGTGIYEARRIAHLKQEIQALHQQRAPLSEQVGQLREERDETKRQLAMAQQEVEGLRRATAELPKLRGEVLRLRTDAQEQARSRPADDKMQNAPTEAAAKSWLSRVNLLKQHLEQAPGARIPELKFLTEEDWLDVARDRLDTDIDYRMALSRLRGAAERRFGSVLQAALKQYQQANQSQWPTDLSQLQPFSESPLDAAALQRWEIAPAERVPNVRLGGDWILTQKAPVDEEYDQILVYGSSGNGSTGFRTRPAASEKWELAPGGAGGTGGPGLAPATGAGQTNR